MQQARQAQDSPVPCMDSPRRAGGVKARPRTARLAAWIPGGSRQVQASGRAVPEPRFNDGFAAVQRRQRFYQRQPEPGAFLLLGMGAVYLLERAAETLEILRRNTDAGVAHGNLHTAIHAHG